MNVILLNVYLIWKNFHSLYDRDAKKSNNYVYNLVLDYFCNITIYSGRLLVTQPC